MILSRRRKTAKRGAAERLRHTTSRLQSGRSASLPPELYERIVASILFAGSILLLVSVGRFKEFEGLSALISGSAILCLGGWYFFRYEPEARSNLRRMIAIYLMGMIVVAVASVVRRFGPLYWHAIPLPLAGIFATIIFHPRIAIGYVAILGALCAVAVGLEAMLLPAMMGLFGGALFGSLLATRVRRRSTLIQVGLLTGVMMAAIQFAYDLQFVQNAKSAVGGDAVGIWTWETFFPSMMMLAHGVITGFLLTGLLPAIEHLTGTVTDIRLLELSNQNEQSLLRQLLLVAPGTHHHSFMVGQLAEAAAKSIGADAMLCRVGAYYHDIGKMNKPEYFSENSPDASARHADLSPEMSVLIITAHPKDGLELADYYGLPDAIRPFIAEHHGTTAVEYFYRKAVEQRGEENVNRESFRYPGPKPQSRESAILMLADSVEATSRTLKDPNPSRLESMIERITELKMEDNQFDECPVTMREINAIQEAFLQVLVGIFHSRPRYPSQNSTVDTGEVPIEDLKKPQAKKGAPS